MVSACYEMTGYYKDDYQLAKKLVQSKLTANERKKVYRQYVLNGYVVACTFIKCDETGKAEYRKGRELLEEIAPYADEQLKEYVLPKIPLTWYFESSEYTISQKYDEVLVCLENAYNGFHKLGCTKNEISVLKGIASIKSHLYDVSGAMDTYGLALSLACQTNDDSERMAVLKELWKLSSTVDDMGKVSTYDFSMDSLVETTVNQQVKFDYCN